MSSKRPPRRPSRQAGSREQRPQAEAPTTAGVRVVELDPRQIVWAEHRISSQYDQESQRGLQESMALEGQQDPIVVYQVGDAWMGAGGMHRCMAAIENGAPTILAVVRQGSEMDVIRANYVTGLHQQKADPLSVAETLWHDHNILGIDMETLAQWSGRGVEYVAGMMRIALADPGIKQALGDGIITQGHAELLARLDDPGDQREWLHRLLSERLTIRELADLMAGLGEGDSTDGRGQAPVRGTRRSTKPQSCSVCSRECDTGAVQTLQVCDECFGLQTTDRDLAGWVRRNVVQLRQASTALAEQPEFVWLAEGIDRLLEQMEQTPKAEGGSDESSASST